MADTAFQIRYRQEFIAGFEQHQSLLRQTVTTEAEINAQQAVFLVADSGGATAVTRGINGLIPYRTDNLQQNTATLVEWHDGVRRTRFNLYASQGDGRRIMQETTRSVLNRKIDQDIIGALQAGTQFAGTSASTMSLSLAMFAMTILGNNAVPLDGNISAIISPAARAYLMQTKEFANVQYVNNKPFENQPEMFRWAGVNWITHPNVPGIGTSSETLFMYHKSAIGHAVDSDQIQTAADYMAEHDYSWARATAFMGSKMLQNKGIVQIRHDGSAYAATA